MCVSTSLRFPCVVSSAFGVTEQVEARLMPPHTTPGKGQCRAEPQCGGAPEETSLLSLLWLGWHVSSQLP